MKLDSIIELWTKCTDNLIFSFTLKIFHMKKKFTDRWRGKESKREVCFVMNHWMPFEATRKKSFSPFCEISPQSTLWIFKNIKKDFLTSSQQSERCRHFILKLVLHHKTSFQPSLRRFFSLLLLKKWQKA